MNNNFYDEIHNIQNIIDYIEDNNREHGYEVEKYMLELPELLTELILCKQEINRGYMVSKEYEPCVMCKKPTNIIEVCSEGYFCSKECEDKFMEEMMKYNN